MTFSLFSWGANSYGQLGLGNQDDQLLPQRVVLPETSGSSLLDQPEACKIKSVTGGGGHSVIIHDDGSLFTCGNNCNGQLGLNHYNNMATFTRVSLSAAILKASAGWDFTVVLSEKGEIFVFGSNEFGQLSFHPEELQKSFVPVKVTLPAVDGKIADIATGLRHTAVLTDEGKIFSWGTRRKIKDKELLTQMIKKSSETPVLESQHGEKFVKISAGSFHTLALTENGNIWIFGTFKYGVATQDNPSPGHLMLVHAISNSLFDGPIVKLDCGWTHCIVQSASGRIFTWGRGDYGQLGRSCNQSHDSNPHPIEDLLCLNSFQCGSEHNLAITNDGRLFTWGWNEHGMCATGDESNVVKPTEVKAVSKLFSVDCGAGAGHCFLLCRDNA